MKKMKMHKMIEIYKVLLKMMRIKIKKRKNKKREWELWILNWEKDMEWSEKLFLYIKVSQLKNLI